MTSEIVFEGATYIFPPPDAEALFHGVIAHLTNLRLAPMDVVIERYDQLKDKPLLMDRLLDRALRAKTLPKPTKEEVAKFMTSYEGQIWTVWWSLSRAYPDFTVEKAEAMLIHQGTAMAVKDAAQKVKEAA